MTPTLPPPGNRPGPWSRPWFRRLTYLIASGAVLGGLGSWAVQRPEVDRWIIGKLDRYSRDEFGLAVQAGRLEVHPFQGRILLYQLTVGGDLLQADLLELDLEWASLLHTPHIRKLLLQTPLLNLDRTRLARIKLKPHPEKTTTSLVRLDRLEIRNGQASVREPAWGIPRGDFNFQATGKGWGPNQVWVDLRMPSIALGQGAAAFQGNLAVTANVTDRFLEVDQGRLQLGGNQLAFKGGLRFLKRTLNLDATGSLDLVQVQRLLAVTPAASGRVDFQGHAEGPFAAPAWTGSVQGQDMKAKSLPLHPGNLAATASGNPAGIRLDRLTWNSQDGRLDAKGTWTPKGGALLKLDAEAIPLAPVAGYTRTGFLKDLMGRFAGEASLAPNRSRTPWTVPNLEQLTFHGSGDFLQGGRRVGGLSLDLEQSRIRAAKVALNLPELELQGSASGTLGKAGLTSLEGDAGLTTDAANVAGVLAAWDIGMKDAAGRLVPMDMAGQATAQARLGWAPQSGIHLTGHLAIKDPRWHGAVADNLGGDVAIDRDVMKVTGIVLDKGDGKASGDLWLTWADLPRGVDQLDMRYQALDLPIREGLKAADQGDLPLDGIGSGWVRLHGPFDRIMMEGQASAEQGEAYGVRIPAASADFTLDLESLRLKATDMRVADSLEHLGPAQGSPAGALALQGSMDMDIERNTWQVALRGTVDSQVLELPGPHFQAQVEASLDGPFTAPLGPIQLPTGTLAFVQGSLSQGDQSLDGLEGSFAFTGGALKARLGLAGKPKRLLSLDAAQRRPGQLAGTLELDLGQESANTQQLATRLTQNFLKDAHFQFHAQGDWTAQGLHWVGHSDSFNGQFDGFSLVQPRPGRFSGDARGVDLALELEGVANGVAPDAAGLGAASLGAAHISPSRPEGTAGPGLPSATSMTLHGRVPFSTKAPLAVQLAGSSNLANLKTLLDRVVQPGQYSLLADLHPEGSAVFDLNLGGSIEESTLDGTLSLKGGRLVVHSYPLSVENLDFTAQFQGRDIIIPKTAPMRGTLAQGALTAWGKATWRLGGISSYDLHSSLEDFQIRDLPEGFELQGSLDAALKGSDQDGGLLSGSIWAKRTLYRTDINLSDLLLSSAISTSGIMSGLDPSDPLARIDLNLEVHLAEPWELDTNLLKMQGRPNGPFWIRGTLAQPGLKGRMELLPGGRLTNLFPAGDIVLERGMVDFTDPSMFNPNIDVQGQIDIPPYLVSLDISGTLDALQAKPISIPSLRQDEIFAILIDPAAVTTVGNAPGAVTQTAMNTGLAGTSTGLLTSLALANFQEQLRKTLNLDRVSVALRAGVGAPETTITLGKSINLFGYRTPLVFTHDKAGDVTTISGQVEWRFGDFVFRLGASQSTADSLAPSGEIRHTWSPR